MRLPIRGLTARINKLVPPVPIHADIFDVLSGAADPGGLDDTERQKLEGMLAEIPDKVPDAIEARIAAGLADPRLVLLGADGEQPTIRYGLRELPDPDLTIDHKEGSE